MTVQHQRQREPSLQAMASFLDEYLRAHLYAQDQAGIYRASTRPVKRIGLALEAWEGLNAWVKTERLDALFLHRPWRLEERRFDESIGVLAYHLAFDEHLTLGFNTRLADALALRETEVIGEKEGRPLGMIGKRQPSAFNKFRQLLREMFDGDEEARAPASEAQVERVAIVGAMTDRLVREAHGRGANVYVTGQWRHPAREAVAETGIGVIAVGHRRTEEWGLRSLADLLRKQWSELEVVLPT